MPKRMGRPPKGDRYPHTVRFPREHLAVYQRRAAAAGLALGDYVAREMALRHGLDLPPHLDTDAGQLPLTG